MSGDKVIIIVGNIIHCIQKLKINVIENGFVIVQGRKILELNKESGLTETLCRLNLRRSECEVITLKKSQILIPGLVDTHIHAPQYPNCGLGYDKPLLEWLNTYTYPLEKRYQDQTFCQQVFNAVVRKTLDSGTTTACYFASLFNDSSMVLVDAAVKHGQRAFVGKINMTTLAPDDYIETPADSIDNTKIFIKDVKSRNTDLVQPIITPRFALSVDMDLMLELGQIAQENDLNIQTHVSENVEEVSMINTKYGIPYVEVYDEANLLTSKTILAHGIYLSDAELDLLGRKGTSISHCPQSNTCLKSGLCNVRKLLSAGVKVGLGTDVAGGPSPSVIAAMRAALDVSIHLSLMDKCCCLTYEEVFYLATLGGAEALALENKIGNFKVAKEFDALIVDMDVENGATDLLLECSPLEILQKFIYSGDDRNIANVFVAGRKVK